MSKGLAQEQMRNSSSSVELTFLGTGTSQGVPMIGCRCEVCTSSDARDHRLRSSVLIRTKGKTIVIDSSMDFRYQMLRERVDSLDAVLYTHEHKDHTGGMDDVRGFNYIMGRPMNLYCEERVQAILKKDFNYAFAEHPYPGVPEVILHTITERPFMVQDIEIEPIRGIHYRLPVLGFRIGGICYITDINQLEEREIEKIKGVDVLVINALRREPHISHLSLSQALGLISRIKPTRAYLTHISHQLGLYKDVSKELPSGVFLAYDGLKLTSYH